MLPPLRFGDPVAHAMRVPRGVIIPAMTPSTGGLMRLAVLPAAYLTGLTAHRGGIFHPSIQGA